MRRVRKCGGLCSWVAPTPPLRHTYHEKTTIVPCVCDSLALPNTVTQGTPYTLVEFFGTRGRDQGVRTCPQCSISEPNSTALKRARAMSVSRIVRITHIDYCMIVAQCIVIYWLVLLDQFCLVAVASLFGTVLLLRFAQRRTMNKIVPALFADNLTYPV